jgi:hypothetical protein
MDAEVGLLHSMLQWEQMLRELCALLGDRPPPQELTVAPSTAVFVCSVSPLALPVARDSSPESVEHLPARRAAAQACLDRLVWTALGKSSDSSAAMSALESLTGREDAPFRAVVESLWREGPSRKRMRDAESAPLPTELLDHWPDVFPCVRFDRMKSVLLRVPEASVSVAIEQGLWDAAHRPGFSWRNARLFFLACSRLFSVSVVSKTLEQLEESLQSGLTTWDRGQCDYAVLLAAGALCSVSPAESKADARAHQSSMFSRWQVPVGGPAQWETPGPADGTTSLTWLQGASPDYAEWLECVVARGGGVSFPVWFGHIARLLEALTPVLSAGALRAHIKALRRVLARLEETEETVPSREALRDIMDLCIVRARELEEAPLHVLSASSSPSLGPHHVLSASSSPSPPMAGAVHSAERQPITLSRRKIVSP